MFTKKMWHTHSHWCTYIQFITHQWKKCRVGGCLCLILPNGSYIKFSPRHKLGPAVTLSGRVPNHTQCLGSNIVVVSTKDRPFWSICWVGGAHGSGWETCWSTHRSNLQCPPVNCTRLHALHHLFSFLVISSNPFMFLAHHTRGGIEAQDYNVNPKLGLCSFK